jgi:putative two-component system response regulator
MAVLVLEPEGSTRARLQGSVVAAGHLCDCAATPEEARALTDKRRYDLLMTPVDADGAGRQAEFIRNLVGGKAEAWLIALTERDNTAEIQAAFNLGALAFVAKPLVDQEVAFALRAAENQRQLLNENKGGNQRMQQEVLRQTKELLDTIGRLERTEMRIRRSQEETIYRLARAAEFRDNETGRHLQRMSHYSALLARKTGLDHDRCELIRVASPMHDIGKIGIPDNILYKNGKHTPDEFEVMKQHAEMGYTILKGSHSELLDTAAMIAWTHHEKWDGGGYPRKLAGEAIPFEGRVVAIADVFDALTSKRVYKPAFPLEKAQEIMNEGAGKHFDPHLLDLFWANLPEALEIKERYSDPEEHHAAIATPRAAT